MTLGQNIARLRTQKNLSQGDLADALEVSRQSVSKWETDASIPELDKLLRLAELFGVTLDELVKGESAQPEAARGEAPDKESAGAYTAATPAARRETRQIVGTILLCFGALIGILIMLFAGTLAGFILALPLFVCGTICLTVRRRTGLWCAWALYIGFALYMRYATGLVAGNIFRTLSWTVRDNYLRLLFSWIIALLLLTMIACTLYSYRAQVVRWGKRNIALLAAGWLALGSRYALAYGSGTLWGRPGAEPLLANRAVQYARFDQRFCRGRAPRSHRSALARLGGRAEAKQNKKTPPVDRRGSFTAIHIKVQSRIGKNTAAT